MNDYNLYFEDIHGSGAAWLKATLVRLSDPDNYLFGVRAVLSDEYELARTDLCQANAFQIPVEDYLLMEQEA